MHLRNAFLILALFTTSTLLAEIRVSTRFEPARVPTGGTSKYIVEIIETDDSTMPKTERVTTLPIPQINTLTMRNGRIAAGSQRTQITNGVREYSNSQQLIIDAASSTEGSFTIPGYIFEYKGGRLQAPAATLTVVKRSADDAPTVDELIFLKADAPQQLYVGQTTPIILKLYVSSNVQLRGMNPFERNADGFTVSDQPEEYSESVEMANGRRYRVYSWPLTITPISAGAQDLDFQLTVSVQMPDQRNTRGSQFGGGMFDNFFGRSERFNIYTPPTQVDVRALPTEGKPKSFSGAIGQFNMEVTSDSTSTRVEEPIMLSLKLSGRGNFDRIKGPEMPKTRGWRNYKPESTYEPSNSQPLKGVKRFDYVFIPETAGNLKLPKVSFSFFDPKTEKYVELTSPAPTVKVALSKRPAVTTTPTETDNQDSTPAINLTKALSPEELLITLDYRPEQGRHIETDLLSSRLFYGLNGIGLVALTTAGILIYRRKCLHNNPDYALAHEAKQALKKAIKDSQSSDAGTFYHSAQCAIRLAATARMKRNLRSADFAELEALFKQSQVNGDVIEQAHTLFNEADNHRFSGRTHSADLQRGRTQLNTILKAL
ncbi:MAG: protein BatD [Opitutae bacterium]|nr:protein BatD [Opitutae bacterium]